MPHRLGGVEGNAAPRVLRGAPDPFLPLSPRAEQDGFGQQSMGKRRVRGSKAGVEFDGSCEEI